MSDLPTTPTNPSQAPLDVSFAADIRSERLRTFWFFALVASLICGYFIFNTALVRGSNVITPMLPFIATVVGLVLTRILFSTGREGAAINMFALSMLVLVGLNILLADAPMVSIFKFSAPVFVYALGLLLSRSGTIRFALLNALMVIALPLNSPINGIDIGAVLLIGISATVTLQIVGDLATVAEWALSGYQRERGIANELFANRQELERSLARTRALSERLQIINAELDDSRLAAEQAKRFRGQFLANMSHELRTPLNAIIGFSETMLNYPEMYDGVTLPDTYRDDLQQINTSGQQLLIVINDILDLSRVDAGRLEVFPEDMHLRPLIDGVLTTAQGLIVGKSIRLDLDLPDDLPTVFADGSRLRQVLLNLYGNAAKFTPAGAITLRVGIEDERFLRLSLQDTGVGIPADQLETIFEEFKQVSGGTRDPRAGAGLGLAIARQLMTLMGGSIWAESTPGQGSTFHLLIPRSAPPHLAQTLEITSIRA